MFIRYERAIVVPRHSTTNIPETFRYRCMRTGARCRGVMTLVLGVVFLTGSVSEHAGAVPPGIPLELRPGYSFHAFDHLHNYGKQAEAAAASGVTVIYATGLGSDGYTGLPPADQWEAHKQDSREYAAHAKALGIQSVLGYLCATSIVGLESFDDHWPEALRNTVHSEPATWRQQDSEGRALPSWYGGEYHPACMNHPDWRAYQQFMVRAQLETGHAGIFFDNPTVHPKGCYCPYCMDRFVSFLQEEAKNTGDASVETMRRYALDHPDDFKRFRCTIARDFLGAMREYGRSINPNAVITANNSLNHRDVLFSQCHDYAYNLQELSKTEDFVVIEDMSAQPRVLEDGKVMECAPTYAQLHAIIHGKPLVAVTIAENDYHTPPNLVRLAMFEAAAHNAGYMLWPTWPEAQRGRMASMVRPYADWLRSHAELISTSRIRRDVLVFLPFRQWVATRECAVTAMARELTAANLPYEVVDEDRFAAELVKSNVLLLEKRSLCSADELGQVKQFEAKGGRVVEASTGDWLMSLRNALGTPSLVITGPSTVRGVVRDLEKSTAIFLYNLNLERLSSFEDNVVPAQDVVVEVQAPFSKVRAVSLSDPEGAAAVVPVEFRTLEAPGATRVRIEVPTFNVGVLVLVEGAE